jgi:heat shock protein HslJ
METQMKKIPFLFAFLVITSLMMSACAGGTTSLEGEWTLVSYGASFSPVPALPDVEAFLSFGADGQFGGNVGCNGFGAEYKADKSRVTFGAIMSTMMYCEATTEQESLVLGILNQGELTYQMDGNILTLTSADGDSVIVLARK